MSMIRQCDCDFDQCKNARNVRNAHVDDQCVHYFGSSHKIGSNWHARVNPS